MVKANNEKTRVVVIELRSPHRLYGKGLTRSSTAVAHDEQNEYTLGDVVRIEETKPISKTKTWQVKDRVTAGGTQAVEADLEVEAAGN